MQLRCVLGQGELRSNLPESNLPESGERSRCQLLLRSLAPLIFLSELSSMYVCAGSFLRPGRFIEAYTIRDLFHNTFCNTLTKINAMIVLVDLRL